MSQKALPKSEEKEMTFLEHLEELRWRIIRALIAIFLVAIVVFLGKSIVFDNILFFPLQENFPTYVLICKISNAIGLEDALCFSAPGLKLQSVEMIAQFTMHLMASGVGGLILAFPFVFYQFWAFISPGLKSNEKKTAKGSVFWVSLLFFCGVVFGYYVVVPFSVQFLGNYQVSELVENNIKINSFVSTVTTLILVAGLLFQLPVLITVLARIGVVNSSMLKKYRKHVLVGVLVLSAIITPPDVASQVLIALPIFVLYEIGIKLAKRVEKKLAAEAD